MSWNFSTVRELFHCQETFYLCTHSSCKKWLNFKSRCIAKHGFPRSPRVFIFFWEIFLGNGRARVRSWERDATFFSWRVLPSARQRREGGPLISSGRGSHKAMSCSGASHFHSGRWPGLKYRGKKWPKWYDGKSMTYHQGGTYFLSLEDRSVPKKRSKLKDFADVSVVL